MQLSELAAQAFQSFMRVYWDSERRYFYSTVTTPARKRRRTRRWHLHRLLVGGPDLGNGDGRLRGDTRGSALGLVEAIFDGFTSAYPDFRPMTGTTTSGGGPGVREGLRADGQPEVSRLSPGNVRLHLSFHDDRYGAASGGRTWTLAMVPRTKRTWRPTRRPCTPR